MCGIAGYLGSPDTRLLKSMLDSIRHRGPDDEGIFSDDSVALGARRLAIVDIEHGNQPIHNEQETVWAVFNGEIYNFPSIREELIRLGHKFDTRTDTETVVHAYEEWDVSCLQKFRGMFAFAVWDKTKKRLFLARDRIGIKPLYYYSHPNKFLFASEIKALILDPEIRRKPNNQVIYNFLVTGFQSYTGDTFFTDIKELPPAHYMIVDQDQLSLKRYWNLAVSKPDEPRTDEYYASKFRELLLDAIKIRLPENLAIGSFLSGGLDSTSIVCLANSILKVGSPSTNVHQEPQKLFSAFYDEAVADERPFIEEVSRSVATKIDYVFPSTTMRLDDVKTFVYHMDEPVTVLNYYTYWCLARITKEKVRVTFSGQGPDEVLAGHTDHFETYLRELWTRKRIRRLLTELIAGINRLGLIPVLRHAVATITAGRMQAEELLNPTFLASHRKDRIRRERSSLDAALLIDVTRDRLPMHLRVGDRVSSAFATETRLPYLDHRIVEFSFSLPETQKIKNGWSKYVLRNSVKGFIPESVRMRKKFGTPIPMDRWMKDLHQEIRQVFSSDRFREREYFNHAKVLDMYDRYCNGKLRRPERQFYGEALWRILNLELWFEVFFDQQTENKND
jgi:asparagine synthase (glutamine-hydrolysing)